MPPAVDVTESTQRFGEQLRLVSGFGGRVDDGTVTGGRLGDAAAQPHRIAYKPLTRS
jgi:hypothetical protein